MKIKSKSRTPRVINTPGRPTEVGPGETVEVDDDLAKSLLRQPDRWVKAGSKKKSDTSEES